MLLLYQHNKGVFILQPIECHINLAVGLFAFKCVRHRAHLPRPVDASVCEGLLVARDGRGGGPQAAAQGSQVQQGGRYCHEPVHQGVRILQ